uniref:Ku domain-containing protein n=1 Tax=Thelazia callipaeda TaxID=103827 RepID=A0A0N5D8N2_THECL
MDEESDDFPEDFDYKDSGKKCTIFLIDASQGMFSITDRSDSNKNECAFQRSLNIMRLQMINKAVTATIGEYTCCILLNTVKNKSHSIDHVYVLQDVGEVSAERIKEIDKLLKTDDILSAFENTCGGHGCCDYSEALFLCIKRLTSRTPHFQKRLVYLFTNRSNLFGTDTQHLSSTCKNIDDLRNHGVEFSLFPIVPEKNSFTFDILEQLDPNVERNFEHISDLEEEKKIHTRFQFSLNFFHNYEIFTESFCSIPRKQYAHRNITGIDFELGNGLKFSVGIYSLFRSEKIPQATVLNAEENEIVQRVHLYVNKETDEEVALLDEEVIRQRQIGGENVTFSASEIEKLRRLTLPGLLLLGFKPLSFLKITHHVRSSQFLYPLEKNILGSTRMYRTLYEVCMKEKTMIICRYTQKANVPPKLVALVPQSDHNSNVCYSGFHLVYLPFAEDKRDLSEQMTHPDGSWPTASEAQIESARKFVKKLTADFFPEKFYNPVLQKHYKVIEALALDYHEVPEVEDQIQPYFAHYDFQKRVEKELKEFSMSSLPTDYNPEQKKFKKMGKTEEMFVQLLEKLPVVQLRKKAAEELVSVKGCTKKNEIIEAVKKHFGID